jgi:hypothetical protein
MGTAKKPIHSKRRTIARISLPALQHSHPHDPYEAYTDDAMSPEPGSDKGGNSNGAGASGRFGGDSGRSDDGWMSVLDEKDYGKQTRMLKVCLHRSLYPHLLSLPFPSFSSLPSIPSLCYTISDIFWFAELCL